jgi:hypothetical protein
MGWMLKQMINSTLLTIDSNTANWFTVVGTIITFGGFIITIWQLIEVKHKTARYQQQVHDEVVAAQAKIRSGLSLFKVPKASQYIKEAIHSLQQGRIDVAGMRMEDAEFILDEIYCDDNFKSKKNKQDYEVGLKDFKESLRTIQSNIATPDNINMSIIMNNLSLMNSVLSEVSSTQIDSLYGK